MDGEQKEGLSCMLQSTNRAYLVCEYALSCEAAAEEITGRAGGGFMVLALCLDINGATAPASGISAPFGAY